MKDDLVRLIDQIDTIESKFHRSPSSPGLCVPSVDEIYDIPEFTLWIQRVQMELQDIVDRTGDQFVGGALEVSQANYDGWNDRKHFEALKGKLLAMRDNLDKYYADDGRHAMQERKSPKIFISHSSRDKEYVSKLVELLDGMGLDQTQIFCSSLPGYDIPIDTNIFEHLRNQFLSYDLHVFFIHSKNYYQSAVSLNEMGAAWALKTEYSSLLLPGFGFGEMTGVVNSQTIAIKLDNDEVEVKDKLNQLYARLIEEFGLTRKADIIWEQKRDRFIKEVKEIVVPMDIVSGQEDDDIEILENGQLIRKSEEAAGKNIRYCPACYQNYKKLYPIVPGSMARDRFCSNCKMHYNSR